MPRALIHDPEEWLSLDTWKTRHEPDGWIVDLKEARERYDLVFLVQEAVGLTREAIADWCLQRGLNPLQVIPFPCVSEEAFDSEALSNRWNDFFEHTIHTWDQVQQVEIKRIVPRKRVILLAAENVKSDGKRLQEAIADQGLECRMLEDEGILSRSGINFQLVTPEGTDQAGAVVLVPEKEEYFALQIPEEVTDARRVLSLSELEKKKRFRNYRLENIVFLIPRVTTPPVLWRKVYHLAKELVRAHGARVTVLCEETVVAGDGLELDYREARQAGVLFEKTDLTSISFRPTMDYRKIILRMVTERDGFQTEIDCHWIVTVPEWRTIPFELGRLWAEDRFLLPFVRPENVNLGLYALPEPGMFLFPPWLASEELPGAVRDLRHYLEEGVVREQGRLAVDEEKCVLCLTCLRTCPWGAVNIEGGIKRRKAQVRWELCRVCGLCASSCPASAITMAGLMESDRRLFPRVGGDDR